DFGFAVENIIFKAEEKHADLIVMGTKGANGLQEVLIGSNAGSVIEKSTCPVLIIPENAQFNTIDKIVFATDFCDSDFYAIASLAKIGELFNSEIMIIHISQIGPTKDYEKDVLEWFKNELKYKANIEYENISFHDLVGGNVDYELEDFIEKNKVNLLALSMRKRNLFSRLFERSLTKKMAYHTHIPLLAFHASAR
ncbi:MAG TPA: universal stress protein, partial [Bacteroidia bacterium]|nr:universal stress protein [Bacteroidia bacterium]